MSDFDGADDSAMTGEWEESDQIPLVSPTGLVSLQVQDAQQARHLLSGHDLTGLPLPSEVNEVSANPKESTAAGRTAAGSRNLYTIIRCRVSDEIVGLCALDPISNDYIHAGCHIHILPQHRRHGYGTEALRALLDYAFGTLVLEIATLRCSSLNLPMVGLATKMRLPMRTYEVPTGMEVIIEIDDDAWCSRHSRYEGDSC